MKTSPMLIAVRRVYFDEFLDGSKRHEYRRYGRVWNERVFYVGRPVVVSYMRVRRPDSLVGHVDSFSTFPMRDMPDMADLYPDMAPTDLVAAIGLSLDHWQRPED